MKLLAHITLLIALTVLFPVQKAEQDRAALKKYLKESLNISKFDLNDIWTVDSLILNDNHSSFSIFWHSRIAYCLLIKINSITFVRTNDLGLEFQLYLKDQSVTELYWNTRCAVNQLQITRCYYDTIYVNCPPIERIQMPFTDYQNVFVLFGNDRTMHFQQLMILRNVNSNFTDDEWDSFTNSNLGVYVDMKTVTKVKPRSCELEFINRDMGTFTDSTEITCMQSNMKLEKVEVLNYQNFIVVFVIIIILACIVWAVIYFVFTTDDEKLGNQVVPFYTN